MDDCKGVRHEFDSQGTSQCVAHDIGRALLELLGWASPALVILAFVVVAFGVHAPKAYALSAKSSPEMVIDGNMVGDDAGSKGYLCVNCSPYTATLEIIGHYGDLIQITDEQFDWLMGGNNPFHALADKWKELKGGEGDEPSNTWMGSDDFLDGWLILAGKGNCWYGTFTDNQIRMAEIAFNSIMQGGTGEEGGGSGGSNGDTVTVNGVEYVVFDTVDVPEEFEQRDRKYAGVCIKVQYLDWIKAQLKNYDYASDAKFWIAVSENDIVRRVAVVACAVGKQPEFTKTYNNPSFQWVKWNDTVDVTNIGRIYVYGTNVYETNGKKYLLCSPVSGAGTVGDAGVIDATRPVYSYYFGDFEGNGGGDDEPPQPPDVPKPPDDPEPPSPTPPTPDPPKPKDPTPRTPTPKPDPPTVYPKIDLPDVHITTEPTNTEPTDYTPWLRAIYNELKAFHEDFGTYFQDLLDELENHCQHIRDEISTQASYLGDCVEDVANEVTQQGNNLSNTIWEYADWLSKYMDAFGEWLVEHLSWNNEVNVDPYDDTSLMYWIRRIYTKLGGSNQPVNSRPTDPVLNPKDTGNWLNELWENILKELAQLFPNLMIDLGLIFDDLKSKFPFSIPWDIHALLVLLVTEPEAPHFTVPMYALTTSYELEQIGEYDIDLSIYTDYLMGVHLMLEIAWIGYMLKHTQDYMELIEAVIPS